MKKFALLLMGPQYDPQVHRAAFETEGLMSCLYTVRNFEEAKEKILELQRDGVGAVEVCGAFGPERAEILTQLTQNQVAIGYVTHDPKLDNLFESFFGKS